MPNLSEPSPGTPTATPGVNTWLRCAIYPHYYWAWEIENVLRKYGLSPDATIVDAPCGEGLISYWLARAFPGNKFELVDQSGSAMTVAGRLLPGARLIRGDLYDQDMKEGSDVWLLINSLFLLPEPERIVRRMRSRASSIVGIFPYLEHSNYRCFMQDNPDFSNTSAMSQKETLAFFERCGYSTLTCFPLTPVPYHCMRVPFLNGILRRLYLLLDPVYPAEKGAYWLGVFNRS